jgi:hypothetical protein
MPGLGLKQRHSQTCGGDQLQTHFPVQLHTESLTWCTPAPHFQVDMSHQRPLVQTYDLPHPLLPYPAGLPEATTQKHQEALIEI